MGHQKITGISYKAKMNHSQIKDIVADLVQKRLVEERRIGKRRTLYAATPKAKTIISHYEEFKEILPTEHNQTV
jgi:predicted transcriptional regulator